MGIIEKIISAKKGDKEFILTGRGNMWEAAIGNPSSCVPIGEGIAYGDSGADFIAYGDSPEEALQALLLKVGGA